MFDKKKRIFMKDINNYALVCNYTLFYKHEGKFTPISIMYSFFKNFRLK